MVPLRDRSRRGREAPDFDRYPLGRAWVAPRGWTASPSVTITVVHSCAGCAGTVVAQPVDEVVALGAVSCGGVERCALGVVWDPVRVGAPGQQVFGGATLPSRAGVPERL